MPPTEEILRSLKFISENYITVSIVWHLLVYFSFLLLFFQRRKPTKRTSGFLMTLPIFSVAVISALSANFFNAIVFFIIGLLIFIFCFRLSRNSGFNSPWFIKLAGIIFILSACLYPHFSENLSLIFLTAPIGVIPCPTLLLVIGVTLIVGPLSQKWTIVLICAALFYGLFGMIRLKVNIDVVLLLTLIPLFWQLFRRSSSDSPLIGINKRTEKSLIN
jgi:hypothetical protein